MHEIALSDIELTGLSNLNIILGKNGCGKSRLLREIDQHLGSAEFGGRVKYLSPERGGAIEYDAGQAQAIQNRDDWLSKTRRNNQVTEFRKQSAVHFRALELLTLRKIEQDEDVRGRFSYSFDTVLRRINGLLDHIKIKRNALGGFTIHNKYSNTEIPAAQISSGESELVSLSIECLLFESEALPGEDNVLLMDEPDLHLHPDAQAKFGRFLSALALTPGIQILLATHSTSLVSSFGRQAGVRITFMQRDDEKLVFQKISYVHESVLPIFGAHPLSNVFSRSPILLVEGEDDERIWQQAIRSSSGTIQLFPREVGGLSGFAKFEPVVEAIIAAVYDDAVAYSLRDRDSATTDLVDSDHVVRMRLGCRASENLLITDDVLESRDLQWSDLEDRIGAWLDSNPSHSHFPEMLAFRDSGYDRSGFDLKQIRIDLLGLMETNTPWEVLVGKAIGRLKPVRKPSPNSLQTFLGEKVLAVLL